MMKQGDAILFLLEWCPCKLKGCQTIDAKRDCQDVLLLQCDSTGLAMIPVYDRCNSALCTIHVPYPSSTRVYPGAVWVGMPPDHVQFKAKECDLGTRPLNFMCGHWDTLPTENHVCLIS